MEETAKATDTVEKNEEDVFAILEKNKDAIEDYDKLRRHLGKRIAHKFKNDDGTVDTFYFKPLDYEMYFKFVSYAKNLKSGSLSNLESETLRGLFELLVDVVANSYPSWPRVVCKEFVANNIDEMLNVMDKLMPKAPKRRRDIKKLQRQLGMIGPHARTLESAEKNENESNGSNTGDEGKE